MHSVQLRHSLCPDIFDPVVIYPEVGHFQLKIAPLQPEVFDVDPPPPGGHKPLPFAILVPRVAGGGGYEPFVGEMTPQRGFYVAKGGRYAHFGWYVAKTHTVFRCGLDTAGDVHGILSLVVPKKFSLSPCIGGRPKRSARAMQLFGRLAVVETHTLWFFGHHCCLAVGFDALGIWHFWMFPLFHPFLLFCTHFLPISTTSSLFLG